MLLWHRHLKGYDFQRLIEGHIWVKGIWETKENTAGPLQRLNLSLSFKTAQALFLLEAYLTSLPVSLDLWLAWHLRMSVWAHRCAQVDENVKHHLEGSPPWYPPTTSAHCVQPYHVFPVPTVKLPFAHFGKGHHLIYRLMDTGGKIWHIRKTVNYKTVKRHTAFIQHQTREKAKELI